MQNHSLYMYMNSFLSSTIELWNALPNEIKQNPSISNFKHFLSTISSRRTIPLYFLTGIRSEQILHPKLRLNCSLLNAHLHSRNIVKSPNYLCGSTETTEHYFIHFPIYSSVRTRSQMSLNNINILFEDPNLSIQENTDILKQSKNSLQH